MWQNWDLLQKVYFCVAVLFSVVLIVQFILLLVGVGNDVNGDADVDSDGFEGVDSGLALFTIKGLISFFAIGGWTGFAFADGTLSPVWVILISLGAGAVALIAVGLLMKWILSLASNGTKDVNNAVGKIGEVYLTIPEKCIATGKISIELQGQLTEIDAMTESQTPIKTGTKIKVIRTEGGVCIVEALYPSSL